MIDHTHASVTIHDAQDMTPAGRTTIADWLRKQADAMEAQGDRYAERYCGRYVAEAR